MEGQTIMLLQQSVQDISFDRILVMGLAAIFIWGFITMNKKGVSLHDVLLGKNRSNILLLELFSGGSTMAEVFQLVNKKVELGSTFEEALLRYGFIGLFEMLIALMFIRSVTEVMREYSKDGVIDWSEWGNVIKRCGPLWLLSVVATQVMAVMYLESAGKLSTEATGFLASWDLIHVQAVTSNIKLELGAFILVYSTQILNIIVVMELARETKKILQAEHAKAKAAKNSGGGNSGGGGTFGSKPQANKPSGGGSGSSGGVTNRLKNKMKGKI